MKMIAKEKIIKRLKMISIQIIMTSKILTKKIGKRFIKISLILIILLFNHSYFNISPSSVLP